MPDLHDPANRGLKNVNNPFMGAAKTRKRVGKPDASVIRTSSEKSELHPRSEPFQPGISTSTAAQGRQLEELAVQQAQIAESSETEESKVEGSDDISSQESSLRGTAALEGQSNITKPAAKLANIAFGHLQSQSSGKIINLNMREFSSFYEEQSVIRGSIQSNSKVSKARRICDEKVFTVKTINSADEDTARKEIRAADILGSHPRIFGMVEYFNRPVSDAYRLIFEHADITLSNWITRERGPNKPWLQKNANSLIYQIVLGIHYIHRHDIAHRNVNPDSIMVVCDTDGQPKLKIADFSLARLRGDPVQKGVRNEDWAAPHSFMLHDDDRLVDVYGTGRVLYYILTEFGWPIEPRRQGQYCTCFESCETICIRRQDALLHLVEERIENKFIHFLKNVLVTDPEECMEIDEMVMDDLFDNIHQK
ncbi:hypothetical protein FRB90_012090 [Tulasnella sp. 427]|nr:hypothetical protein FRB90_012090 [Tulasnella sp. 427]